MACPMVYFLFVIPRSEWNIKWFTAWNDIEVKENAQNPFGRNQLKKEKDDRGYGFTYDPYLPIEKNLNLQERLFETPTYTSDLPW